MNMGNIHLVTGYAGREHITAEDQGAFNANVFGSGQFVFKKGNDLSAQVVSNNRIRIADGEISMQGRFIKLNAGEFADLTIENGNQGFQRNDLIVARYVKDGERAVEDCNLVVIKGQPVASNPVDPEYTTGDVLNGFAIQNDMPLYRVKMDGLAITAVEQLFEFGMGIADALGAIAEALDTINGEVV
jgi:hypothetical protein